MSIKTKQEKREEERRKKKIKASKGGTLAGQAERMRTNKGYLKEKKK